MNKEKAKSSWNFNQVTYAWFCLAPRASPQTPQPLFLINISRPKEDQCVYIKLKYMPTVFEEMLFNDCH